ncbi:hypothetical protein WN51_03277 [Melipona quadrifasciata]|uniref:Uncharacterized protein n=1 Tax=Melipona quadrifasciata TaxID=166423 RepID=A0A0N0U4R2_9HYME|nr:hypothetical protein WN51_03277 [Melipona quadrifasciata]
MVTRASSRVESGPESSLSLGTAKIGYPKVKSGRIEIAEVCTVRTRMTRNHMQVKTLRMLEELAIAEEKELNNDGDSLDSGTSSPTSNNHLHSPEKVDF